MNNQNVSASQASIYQQKYKNSRSNLLLMIGFTAINIILLAFGSDVMLLFSATVPYLTVLFGIEFENSIALLICITLAVINICIYLLCWFFSKKHPAWMIVSLVLFSIDTLVMLGLYLISGDFSGVLDIAIHIWVMYYLIVGVSTGFKLKSLPAEMLLQQTDMVSEEKEDEIISESVGLRVAEPLPKVRVLLETNYMGHQVCYRRVKRTNELVIDGYVYDEVEMLIETRHILTAKLNGHIYQAGFDGDVHSFILIDGDEVARKLRLW